MMRRILFVLMMAATMLVANAESGEWAVGGQVVYGSKAEWHSVKTAAPS